MFLDSDPAGQLTAMYRFFVSYDRQIEAINFMEDEFENNCIQLYYVKNCYLQQILLRVTKRPRTRAVVLSGDAF